MYKYVCMYVQEVWKNSGPSKLEFFSGFIFTTAQVVFITAMINHIFISFSAVQIYDL